MGGLRQAVALPERAICSHGRAQVTIIVRSMPVADGTGECHSLP